MFLFAKLTKVLGKGKCNLEHPALICASSGEKLKTLCNVSIF